MRPRTIILESDNRLRELLAVLLTSRGHEVHAYAYPVTCPLYQQPDGTCPQESPCADLLITDMQMSAMSGLDLLQLQAEKGCKVMVRNKLLLTAELSEDQKRLAGQLGCVVAQKPFEIPELFDRVAECESRIRDERHLGNIQLHS
jgi:DNA-binding response OmpR family regulator